MGFNSAFKGLKMKMVPIGCPETSASNYHYMLCNIPEERRSHLLGGGSLKSRVYNFVRDRKEGLKPRKRVKSVLLQARGAQRVPGS